MRYLEWLFFFVLGEGKSVGWIRKEFMLNLK